MSAHRVTLAFNTEGFAQAPCGCQLARHVGERPTVAFVVFTACAMHGAAEEMFDALVELVARRDAACAGRWLRAG